MEQQTPPEITAIMHEMVKNLKKLDVNKIIEKKDANKIIKENKKELEKYENLLYKLEDIKKN